MVRVTKATLIVDGKSELRTWTEAYRMDSKNLHSRALY